MRRLALALLCLPGCATAPSVSDRPNVVMIVGDDQHWGDFGFMGHSMISTPRLDALASESLVYPNAYVPTSLCRASLATMLTGQYAHQHKICCNDPPDGVDRSAMLPFLKNSPTIPRLLQSKGYRSFQTGKFWEGHFTNGGFTHGMTEKGRHGDGGLVIGRQTMQPIYDFIASCGRDPFFVWYAPMLPHEPHNPPDRFLTKYSAESRNLKLAKYWAMCEWFDETCGQLLDHLDAKGLRENTVVLFVIDNGWIQELGAVRTTRGNFAPKSKLSPYDGGLRTPIMIRWPGRAKPGRHPGLASTVDIAPTLLRACGVEPPASMAGHDLLRPPLARDAVFGDLYIHTAKALDRPVLNLTHRWIREGDWKLIVPQEGKPELYRVTQDPHEDKDLADADPTRVNALRKRLDSWWSAR